MAQLAIKGHKTRGKEVIQLLEMLGGKNTFHVLGTEYGLVCYIDDKNNIFQMQINDYNPCSNYTIFTLEEFLEKFPYKVGDRIRIAEYESKVCISNMYWDGCEVQYEVVTDEVEWYSAKELNEFNDPNKEDMEGVYAYNEINCYHQDFGDKVRIRLGNDFEIKVEDKITYIVKKQPQYPKDYVKCCECLGHNPFSNNVSGYKRDVIESLQALITCRDTYWKIAGEELGLDKPWKPDWLNVEQDKYVLYTHNNSICSNCYMLGNNILAFPTEEMRDAFYENFKELIEQCKELL